MSGSLWSSCMAGAAIPALKRLDPLLAGSSIPAWRFDHTGMRAAQLPDIAVALGEYITEKRDATGYFREG